MDGSGGGKSLEGLIPTHTHTQELLLYEINRVVSDAVTKRHAISQ